MSPITTHVLDTALGRPAEGVPVTLSLLEAQAGGRRFRDLGGGRTDADGRLRGLLQKDADLAAGIYRLTFDTAAYFREKGVLAFYPEVTVVFEVREPGGHYHVPLLLSPFGYSTYRGS